jgi:GLPGLI family protein
MKRISIIGCALLVISGTQAQQKQGSVVYERTMQMQVSFAGMSDEMQQMIPKSRKDKFELTFGNNQSLYKAAEQEMEDETSFGGDGGGGIQIRMVGQGANDVIYTNLDKGLRVEQREMMDKKFIIDDSVRPLKWKMTGETKTILNHNCMKATATQISQRMQMSMDNGKMERKEVTDTSLITAWFASDIPVSAGPGEYQGQLPGLILEMDINNGRQTFKALEVTEKADLAIIKEPTGKKHYTPAEYRTERDKMLQQMQQNRGGPGRVIRMN